MSEFTPTDYSKIASVYDENIERKNIRPDEELAKLFGKPDPDGRPFRVLDLACGTGSFLQVQMEAFGCEGIKWYGADASPEMLALAGGKVPSAILSVQDAHSLEFEDGFFDAVCCNFAFHHFQNKPRAAAEIDRVLAPGGVFRLQNIAPEAMPGWWVYRFFPAARQYDEARFWSDGRLYRFFCDMGYETVIDTNRKLFERTGRSLKEHARRRDTSEFTGVSEEAYRRGLAMIETLDDGDMLTDEFARLVLTARKAL